VYAVKRKEEERFLSSSFERFLPGTLFEEERFLPGSLFYFES